MVNALVTMDGFPYPTFGIVCVAKSPVSVKDQMFSYDCNKQPSTKLEVLGINPIVDCRTHRRTSIDWWVSCGVASNFIWKSFGSDCT